MAEVRGVERPAEQSHAHYERTWASTAIAPQFKE